MAENYFGQEEKLLEQNFFKPQNLGLGTLPRYVKEAVDSVGILQEVVRHHFTAHGFRTTVITFSLEVALNDQSICRNTGHLNPKSVFAFVNSDKNIGKQLQRDLFGLGCRNNRWKRNLELSGDNTVHLQKHVKSIVEEGRKSELVTYDQSFLSDMGSSANIKKMKSDVLN